MDNKQTDCEAKEVQVRIDAGRNWDTVRCYLESGLLEEKRKLSFALSRTQEKLKWYEERYGLTSEEFVQRFLTGGNDEKNEEFFEWWAEARVKQEIEQHLELLERIRICQAN